MAATTTSGDEAQDKQEFGGGEVLVCGATDFWAILRSKEVRAELYPNLAVPHRIKALEGVKVAFIAAGSAACHSIIADIHGACYTWGRNEKGQLGLGDTVNRNVPTLVEGLKGKRVVGGQGGKGHSAIYTSTGESFAWGLNSYGQCGTGSVKKVKGGEDTLLTPAPAVVSKVTAVACGAEFTMWLTSEGKLWSAGLPQYGQLGHGTDNQYNAAEASVKMVFEPQPLPRPIAALAEKTITRVACGHNHTVAVASDGGCWTWGFGGYGRLGHRVQQDEFKPRLVETLTGRITVPADALVAAGATSSFCTIVGGQLFAWGKLKASGDNLMYPVPYHELAGWNIKSITCGMSTFAVAATYGSETSTITWGHSNGYTELGYGAGGKKSSANPDKCLALEGVKDFQVAMGVGHSLFLVDGDDAKVKKMPVWEPQADKDDAPPASAAAAGKAGKGKAASAGTKRKAPAAKAGKAKK